MNFFSVLLYILTLHLIIFIPFLEVNNDQKIQKEDKSFRVKKIRLSFSPKKKSPKLKSKNREKVQFNMLRYTPSKDTELGPGFTQADASKSSEVYEIFKRIEERLTYPDILKSSKFTGIVKAKIYFNSKGQYLENVSRFEGMNYLKVLVAQTIREAFQQRIMQKNKDRDGFYVTCFFDFRLVTNMNKVRESGVSSKFLYFYKQGLGGERGMDYLNKTASGVFNTLSLLQYLPKSKSLKMKNERELEKYRRDSAWK